MFKFRLARELGLTVSQLEENMTGAEFMEWAVFLGLEFKKKL